MTSLGDMEEEIENDVSLFSDHGGDDSDSQADGMDPPTLYRSTWGDDHNYDIRLYGRIGLQCYNLQKGTNFKFKSWEVCRKQMTSSDDSFITLKATDPATGSVLSFQTLFSDFGPVDDEWDEDTPAIHDFYKGAMPKWFSDEALEHDSKKYYLVPELELHDNDWLQLLMEVSLFSKTNRGFDGDLPLELDMVVVETIEDEPREKLKANNAIFYLSYKCCADPSSTRLAGDHVAIVRKTMDGKLGHMCLEVALTKEQEKE